MLVYSGPEIIELRPQQEISSDVEIIHPYLRRINGPKKEVTKPKVNKRKYSKKTENLDNGNDRKSDT